jgi:hypothetical protein
LPKGLGEVAVRRYSIKYEALILAAHFLKFPLDQFQKQRRQNLPLNLLHEVCPIDVVVLSRLGDDAIDCYQREGVVIRNG